ncbi:MAG: hypothetical protein KatS3mg101_0958 [Patescibacteria group bacterium]|nr:MAG: hypothetical protein KatS3mg101_0958 [Patescibacteria group bacterium]
MGWKVTVYADCVAEKVVNGVRWLPYKMFNPRDNFNIFIQWRSSHLAGKIKARKFLVDLHDVFSPKAIKWDNVDYVMVKSQAHRNLAKNIKDGKFKNHLKRYLDIIDFFGGQVMTGDCSIFCLCGLILKKHILMLNSIFVMAGRLLTKSMQATLKEWSGKE